MLSGIPSPPMPYVKNLLSVGNAYHIRVRYYTSTNESQRSAEALIRGRDRERERERQKRENNKHMTQLRHEETPRPI
jgi:hypothetical protein